MRDGSLDKHQILDAIREYVASHGTPPGRAVFKREHIVPATAFEGMYWAKWGDAVREAGFEPLERPAAMDPGYLLTCLATLTRTLGRFPSRAEVRLQKSIDSTFPTATVFQRRFGTSAEQVTQLDKWCRLTPEFADVLDLLVARPAIVDSTSEPIEGVAAGFVYMLQSGRDFKVGRTQSVPRRWAEIAGGAANEVALVHHFKSDDAVGIELYWHRRFAAMRQGGEWFRLRPQDVAAFKLRKTFM